MAVIEKRESLAGINTLHELLELALEDLAAQENKPGVTVDIHGAWYLKTGVKECKICLAGGVIRRRLMNRSLADGNCVWPEDFDDQTERRLEALYSLAYGAVEQAWRELYGAGEAKGFDSLSREIAEYDPATKGAAWWADMQQLLADLKAAGI